jgi:hypothetical protein
MEHTKDLIADSFGVPGGSSMMTDGHYYWRLDTAEYVAVYGCALPQDFLVACRARAWAAARLSDDEIASADDYIMRRLRERTTRS